MYIFSTLNLLLRVLKKLRENRREKTPIVVQGWKTQTWYARLKSLLMTEQPFDLKASITLLGLALDSQAVYSLHRKLILMAYPLSKGNKSARGA